MASKTVICPKCKQPKENPKQWVCNACHAKRSRETRPKNSELPDEQRKRVAARIKLCIYIKKGKVEKKPCVICGSIEKLEGHHEDYNKPLDVVWYCRKHHLDFHKFEKSPTTSLYGLFLGYIFT